MGERAHGQHPELTGPQWCHSAAWQSAWIGSKDLSAPTARTDVDNIDRVQGHTVDLAGSSALGLPMKAKSPTMSMKVKNVCTSRPSTDSLGRAIWPCYILANSHPKAKTTGRESGGGGSRETQLLSIKPQKECHLFSGRLISLS